MAPHSPTAKTSPVPLPQYPIEKAHRDAARLAPACAVVVQDNARPTPGIAAHDKDVIAAAAPYAIQLRGRAAGHRAPSRAVVAQHGATIAHGKDVACAAAPNVTERVACAAGYGTPTRAVVVQNRAGTAHSKDITATAAPHTMQKRSCTTIQLAPTRAVVVHDCARATHSKDVTAAAAPHGIESVALRQGILPFPLLILGLYARRPENEESHSQRHAQPKQSTYCRPCETLVIHLSLPPCVLGITPPLWRCWGFRRNCIHALCPCITSFPHSYAVRRPGRYGRYVQQPTDPSASNCDFLPPSASFGGRSRQMLSRKENTRSTVRPG